MELLELDRQNLTEYFADVNVSEDEQLRPYASLPNGDEEDEPDDDDDYEETYGDLEDGHDDLNEQESDRGVDNLE